MSRKQRILSAPDRSRHQAVPLSCLLSSSSLHGIPRHPLILPACIDRHGVFKPARLRRKQRSTAIRRSCLYLIRENDIPRSSFCRKRSRSPPAGALTKRSLQSTACYVPQCGQAWRQPIEPPGSNTIVCISFVCTTFIFQKLL